jgi:hypothetical protein
MPASGVGRCPSLVGSAVPGCSGPADGVALESLAGLDADDTEHQPGRIQQLPEVEGTRSQGDAEMAQAVHRARPIRQ